MRKLILHHDTLLQGNFKINDLNFLFVFQVNCPGCFLHGMPLINRLYKEYGEQISFLGLSTAFEDYEYNNVVNTKKLLFRKEVVGATKRSLIEHHWDSEDINIEFPVAMDSVARDDFDYESGAKDICRINPDYTTWTTLEQQSVESRVVMYLKSQEQISLTFTLNQMRGTPSMVVFNDKKEVLYHHFGHIHYDVIKSKLEDLIHILS